MARETTDFRGIIIERRDYRERDLLVKILTDKIGPAMFYVRDGKKRGFRMASDILPFTHGTYIGSLSDDGLSYINTASETHQYQGIATDLSRNAYATYILALADQAFTDNQPIGSWFDQIAAGMELINRGQDEQVVTNVIETQLLNFFGVAPTWDRCAVCERTDRPLDYSEEYGGMLCDHHWHLDERRFHLDRRTVYYLQQFSRLNLSQVNNIKINPTTKKRLRVTLDTIYDDQVGLRLKSKRFINEMLRFEQKMGNLTLGD
ncbi:MAG: DNA repair protein RecO [Limosilactobacillus sp.]|uniref:DNA repair protein RecO n=1 Tax=Limosilactobacillus sp. TaxID=2773925 RepID=UPI002710B450|nr:DNA repair protein RecO [Limosilactobacillus sp.]